MTNLVFLKKEGESKLPVNIILSKMLMIYSSRKTTHA